MTTDQASEILRIPKLLISEIAEEQNMSADLDIHDLAEIDSIYHGQDIKKRRVDWRKRVKQLTEQLKGTQQKLEYEKRRNDLLEKKNAPRKITTSLNWYPNNKRKLVREATV